ncbi:hypothetical protein GGX14DRAFT_395810 [Mycena pura]|uniref:Uncharacterized protein n=1 Tax=Mycena pura TaxID=153505 RepID=A0AAD6VC88_9AGAR|nr:hypothetical protein GGX14DRAFT_395810 [Mycena pura]
MEDVRIEILNTHSSLKSVASVHTRSNGPCMEKGTIFMYLMRRYRMVKLLASTVYVERDGWVFLGESEKPELKLGKQDSQLRTLTPCQWGDQQMIPKWSAPKQPFQRQAPRYDCMYTEVIVVDVPNAIVPLAIHGSGVTCMLLERRAEDDDKNLNWRGKSGCATYRRIYIFVRRQSSAVPSTLLRTRKKAESPEPGLSSPVHDNSRMHAQMVIHLLD